AFVTYGYAALVLLGCAILALLSAWRWAVALLVLAVFYYLGTTGTPWPLTMAVFFAAGYAAGGWGVGLLALGGLGFILVTGSWEGAMISLELCAVGVGASFVIGS